MKEKKYSWMPRSRFLQALMQSPLGILAINWVFQGMRGMQRKELIFRVFLELIMMAVFAGFIGLVYGPVTALVLGFLLAHSINWLFNTHLWVCVRYFPVYSRSPAALEEFLSRAGVYLDSLEWLEEAVFIGSVGDHGRVCTDRSDIDLRLIFPAGCLNWLRTNLLLIRLRVSALFKVIPLDLYAYDTVSALDRFRQDEGLQILLDRRGRVKNRYRLRTQGER